MFPLLILLPPESILSLCLEMCSLFEMANAFGALSISPV